jgi:hypothetical protein
MCFSVNVGWVEFISRPSETSREVMTCTPEPGSPLDDPNGEKPGGHSYEPRPDNGKCSCCGGPAYVGLNEVTCLAAKCEPPVTPETKCVVHQEWEKYSKAQGRRVRCFGDTPGAEPRWYVGGLGRSVELPDRAAAIAAWKALVKL